MTDRKKYCKDCGYLTPPLFMDTITHFGKTVVYYCSVMNKLINNKETEICEHFTELKFDRKDLIEVHLL